MFHINVRKVLADFTVFDCDVKFRQIEGNCQNDLFMKFYCTILMYVLTLYSQ